MDLISWRFTWQYSKDQLKLKYRYTTLGFLWNFLEPAIYLTVLSVVFSLVNRMNISDYAVFLFSALVPWRYFEKIVNTCTDAIVGGDWLLKKMYVSPLSFPMTRWIVASVEFIFSLVIVLVVFVLLKDSWTIHPIIIPLTIIPWSLLGLGLGMIAAVLFTFFRDIRPIIQMLLMVGFFTAPILFKPDLFDNHAIQAQLLRWHPITYFAALFQKPLYEAAWPGGIDWIVSLSFSLSILLLGYALINRYKGSFYYYL
ncbi:MAG: ABC transporter permease [bacterium]|nr:MAG: ABC transporter permease [bacterium]